MYASLAVVGGTALAAAVESIGRPLRIVSGLVLLVIGVVGLGRSGRSGNATAAKARSADLSRTYGRFVGLTVVNPTTVVYFAAIVIGLGVAGNLSAGEGALFVTGAFLASLSWQTVIAAVGAFAGHRLSIRARRLVSVLGNVVILVFAIVILAG